MYINWKSIEILLRSIIDNDIKWYTDEMSYLINTSHKSNKYKQAKELEDINNKIIYYLNRSNEYKNSTNKVTQSWLTNNIKESELYRIYYPNQIQDDKLIYPDYINNKLNEIEKYWEKRDTLAKKWLSYYKKILLYGLPWTWKTQIAFNLAKHLNIPLILVRLDEVISSYLWKTGKNIREIFSLVWNNECVLFFDELDTIWKKRDDNQELWELKRVVTVFLQNMDISDMKWIIIWATNHQDMIDNALWRRFDTVIEIEPPSKREREHIFVNNLDDKVKTTIKNHIKTFSSLLPDSSWSYIKQISNNINRYCLINDSYELTSIMKCFFSSMPWRKERYNKNSLKIIAKQLKKEWFSDKNISSILLVPYTTIRWWF